MSTYSSGLHWLKPSWIGDTQVCIIINNASDLRIALAIEAHDIACFSVIKAMPGAEWHDEPDLLWYASGLPMPLFNGVFHTRCTIGDVQPLIDRTLAYFRARNLPFIWCVYPSDRPEGLAGSLESRGLQRRE